MTAHFTICDECGQHYTHARDCAAAIDKRRAAERIFVDADVVLHGDTEKLIGQSAQAASQPSNPEGRTA